MHSTATVLTRRKERIVIAQLSGEEGSPGEAGASGDLGDFAGLRIAEPSTVSEPSAS